MFKTDTKKIYRQVDKDAIIVKEPPPIEQTEKFGKLFGVKKISIADQEHNVKAVKFRNRNGHI